ncbi:MAG: ABC transporter permease [Legionella sp.]|uniref:ABC transporter permease n=1 Tax=Legionella sp. TaxID=459 RepID=UPI0039E49373
MNVIDYSFISLREALTIQLRVIYALMMREIITRYGRANFGFLWLFFEPMLFTLGVITFRGLFFDNQHASFPLVVFLLTGYLSYISFRNSTSRLGRSASANKGLLYHQNVTVLDLVIARFLLEFLGASGAFLVIGLGFIYFGLMTAPANLALSVIAWILLAWFSLSFGMIIVFLMERSSLFERIWPIVMIALLPLSGVFFMVSWMPPKVQSLLLWSPLVNAIEFLREAFLGPEIHALYSVAYLLKVNLILMLVGLMLLKKIPHYLENS